MSFYNSKNLMHSLGHNLLLKQKSRYKEKTNEEYWTKQEQFHWIIRLFLLTAVLFAARVAMPVCATAMAHDFGWNKADLGVAMGTFFWGYVTTQVIGGYMADKVGGDKVLCLSVCVWGLITLFTPQFAHIKLQFISALGVITLTRVLLGISQGVHYPSMMSLIAKRIPDSERSLPNGIITSAANFGTLMCGGIGSIILEYRNWEVVFYIIGVTSLVCTYSLLTVIRQPKNKVISIDSMIYSYPDFKSSSDNVPWKHIFSKPAVWSLIFAHICMNNCFYIMLSWLPTFFHDVFPNEKGWVYNVIPWAMSIPTSIFGGWLSDRLLKSKWDVGFTRKIMQTIAMVGSGIFASFLPYCTSFYSAVLCAGIAVSVLTFHHSGVLVNPQDIAPKYAGSVFGIMNAFGAIPGFIGVYCTGYILNLTNSWSVVFFTMAAINIIGVSTFVIWGTGNAIT